MLSTHVPNIITKNLAFNHVQGNRKLRVSSNFLHVMGYAPGERLAIIPSANSLSGFTVISDPTGSHQVYSRRYNRKQRNNPLEAVVEFGSQSLLNTTFPAYTERFHVDMRKNGITFTPMANRTHAVHTKFKNTDILQAFVALTGGVDIHCMESLGWKVNIVLEHRPQEARDIAAKRNLTETYALNTLINSSPSILINEDIYSLEVKRLERLLESAPPVSFCHYSLGCDDHSPSKSKAAKEKSFDDLSTMYDMVYPVLKQIEAISPAVCLIENVPRFVTSGAGRILTTTLKRLGYHVTEMKLNALDFGAIQKRERYYMVASIYPNFVGPESTPRNEKPLKSLIDSHINECNEVTHTASIAARKTKNRAMPPFLTSDCLYASTIIKSQHRGVSDAIYIQKSNKIYKPCPALVQSLMSIPDDFDVTWMAKEQAVETLGQSVDYKLHHAVMTCVTDHIQINLGKRTLFQFSLDL